MISSTLMRVENTLVGPHPAVTAPSQTRCDANGDMGRRIFTQRESRKFLGSWINSGAIHEAKKRRATQVITCSFPCGKWLHVIGARASPRCELCRRERRHGQEAIEHLLEETVARASKAQGVKRKRRASLAPTPGVGSIFSVPSPSKGGRNVKF